MRKPRYGQWYWFEAIYRSNIALLICPAKEASARLRKVLPEDVCVECDPIFKDMQCDGRYIGTKHDTSGLFVVFWLKPTTDIAVVAHEALHATYFLLRNKGLILTEESEEAFTYMLEWFVREISLRRDNLASPGGEP